MKFVPLLCLFAVLVLPARASEPYREYDTLEKYEPHVRGDLKLSGSYRYWADPKNLDWRLAGDPDNNWKLNWKFMDPPFNSAVHGGHFALDRGETLYKELNGKGRFGKCVGAGKAGLRGLRTHYPMYRPDLKRIASLEEVIESCAAREGRVLQNGSYDNSAVSLYIASKSNGMPVHIDVSKGIMREAFERGRKLFHMRTGKLNLACSSCHTHQIGLHLRGTVVTTPYGDVAHYPVYRTRYQLQSLHLRFIECNLDTRVQPLLPGSRAYTDLEVFLTALTNDYPVTVPSERD
ncbi:MAG TPA: sulfur oxidation c-type cytochrome SoxA [Thiobacillaceae bacterium]|nr:sulfur oxidation c-type cytochrome SoxA [Thiobacillaceae bacterium]